MEHHSNIVPWQLIAQEKGALLKIIPFNDSGELDMAEFHAMLGPKTRFISVVYVANSLVSNPFACASLIPRVRK